MTFLLESSHSKQEIANLGDVCCGGKAHTLGECLPCACPARCFYDDFPRLSPKFTITV